MAVLGQIQLALQSRSIVLREGDSLSLPELGAVEWSRQGDHLLVKAFSDSAPAIKQTLANHELRIGEARMAIQRVNEDIKAALAVPSRLAEVLFSSEPIDVSCRFWANSFTAPRAT